MHYLLCTDRRPACNAKGTISNKRLYARNVHLLKGQARSQETKPCSCQRGCYVRTIPAKVQLKIKVSCREPQEARRKDQLIGGISTVVKQHRFRLPHG
jgi:hypothetical protein